MSARALHRDHRTQTLRNCTRRSKGVPLNFFPGFLKELRHLSGVGRHDDLSGVTSRNIAISETT
jgi:hypothetical protein